MNTKINIHFFHKHDKLFTSDLYVCIGNHDTDLPLRAHFSLLARFFLSFALTESLAQAKIFLF